MDPTVARRRAPRITAPRVSHNPGLYAAVVLERRSPRILGLTALTSSLESACPTGPSSSEADATDVRARRTQEPRQAHRETSFNRLRCGQAVRAHAMHILCRYLCEDSPRLASFPPICPDSSGFHCFSAICCHPPRGDPDGSLYAARMGCEQVRFIVDHSR